MIENYLDSILTWVSLSEVKVGEVDNIVVTLLGLVEESEFCGSSNNIISDNTLNHEKYLR